MIRSLGPVGILGILLALGGVAVIAYIEPIVAAGFVIAIVGIALAVQALVKGVLAQFGMV